MAEIANVVLHVDELVADTEVATPKIVGPVQITGAVTLSGTLAVQTDGLIVDATKRVLIGTAVTTGSAAGDVVLANNKSLRGVGVAGATCHDMLKVNASDVLTLGGGFAGALWTMVRGDVPANIPSGAGLNGIIGLDTTNNRLFFTVNDLRYYVTGTAF